MKAKSEFGQRLKEIFNYKTNAEISEKIGVSEAAVSNYVRGRIPDAEKLIEISNFTKCSLHWLLTGDGPKFRNEFDDRENGKESAPETIFNEDLLEKRMREIVREELRALAAPVQDLGTIDEYDVEEAVKKYDDPVAVLREWYVHDGAPVPNIRVTALATGWKNKTLEEKVRAIRTFKENIDEDIDFEKRMATSHKPKGS